MKNSCILFGTIVGAIFSISVSAADTLMVKTNFTSTSDSINSVGESNALNGRDFLANNSTGINNPENGRTNPKNAKTKVSNGGSYQSFEGLYAPDIPDFNPLLSFIQLYDVNRNRVYPKPARIYYADEVLDYPKMSPLFMPLVFNAIHREYKLEWREKQEPQFLLHTALLDSIKEVFHSQRFINNLARTIILNAETQKIDQIDYDQKNIPAPEKLVFQLKSHKPISWVKPIQAVPIESPDTKKLPKTEYDPWTKHGSAKLQFSQTYISPNWAKGGESNMAGLATFYYEANYSDLKEVVFDNNIEIKVGINTVSSDTLRNINISTDQLRAVSKLGIKMYNDWYYTLSGEFTTQMLNNYKSNTMSLRSALLSPAKLFIGLGVDYKLSNRKKGYTLSVLLTPLTCKMNYLDDIKNFDGSSYGIEKGHHFGSELGSKIAATLSWKFSDQVRWNSKIYYYTDFTYVDSEWENTLDLNLNHFFSTQIFLHLKANDRLKRDPGQPLIQMQELLSFGLVYYW